LRCEYSQRWDPAHAVMNVTQLKAFCRKLPGATERDSGAPWNILVYAVGDRTFAYFKTSEPERWRFSIKVDPSRFIELTDTPGVKPARFRARQRWITIVSVADFPPAYLRELVRCSYEYAWQKLPVARRPQPHPLSV
jgi:predicted DNA-binding protein (MmcQ/YjbR family)